MKIFYCDGSTRGGRNQKGADNIGGWGAVCFSDESEMHIEAFEHNSETCTTNNRQELKGLLWCLYYADDYHPNEECIIYSDSAYVVNMCNSWIYNWANNGWKNSKKQPVENIELVQDIWRRISKPFYHCAIKKCDGHKGILGNELADALATQSIHIFDDLCKEYEVTLGEEEQE